MSTPIVSFRLKPEVYLKLEAIAAAEGQTPGIYLKKKLESDDKGSKAIESASNQNNMVKVLMPIVLESLLILREVAAPNKIYNAQKLVNKAGVKAYNGLD